MLVRMKVQIGGFRNGEAWPVVGGTIDVPDHEAADLIQNSYAEEAPDGEAAPDAGPEPVGDDEHGSDADDDPEADDDEDPAAPVTGLDAEATAPTKGRRKRG